MEAESKVRKVEPEDQDSDFECYNESHSKLVHVEVDEEITGRNEKRFALALLPKKLKEHKINNFSEIGVGTKILDGSFSVRITSKEYRPPESLGIIP